MGVFFAAITWCLVIEFLGFVTYPVLAGYVGIPKPAAQFWARPLGFFAFGYLIWLLSVTQLLSFSKFSCVSVLIAIYLLFLFSGRKAPWTELKNSGKYFWSFFALCLFICSFHPEIYWGEKPMDFTFLNFFTRTTEIPPTDPWASGNTMKYYYGGTLLFAALHKLSNMPTHFGYWFSVALVQTSLCAAAAGVLILLGISRRWAMAGGILLVYCGNIEALYLLQRPNVRSFDLFWATSRVLHTPGINEYPLWSFLFADLHAHYIALPVTALLLGVVIYLFSEECTSRRTAILLAALLWAMLAFINSWDFLTYGIVIALFFLFAILREIFHGGFLRAGIWASLGISVLIGAVVFSLPFHVTVSGESELGYGFVNKEEFNDLSQILRIHGHWIALILVSMLFHLRSISKKDGLVGIVLATVPFLLGLYHVYGAHLDGVPWAILTFASLLCLVGGLSFSSSFTFGALCVSLGILYTLSELYFFMDRMNTTFKVYNALSILGAVAALSRLPEFFSNPKVRTYSCSAKVVHAGPNESFEFFERSESHTSIVPAWKRGIRYVLNGASLLPLIVACIGGLFCVWIMSTFVRVPGPRPTLNGHAYLETFNPAEKRAFDWIAKNIRGTPVMLEAWGPSYQEYTRFSMHTGLPVVLGWEHHVKQRGTSFEEVMQRKVDIETIYRTNDLRRAQQLLNKYRVDLIIVGKQERLAYENGDFEKFDANPALFPLLFTYAAGQEVVKIYTTSYSSLRP